MLLSALLHATWNALLRLEPDKDRGLILAIATSTVLASIVSIGRWYVEREPPFVSWVDFTWTVVAGVLEFIYFWSLAQALSRGRLGPVYTISRGGAILVVWPVSVLVFAETVTLRSSIGSAVVFGGLALSSLGTGDTRKTRLDALAWAVACAVSIAGYHLAYKAALREGGSGSAVFAVSLAVASVINVARLGREGRRVARELIRTRLTRILAMGTFCGGSFLILIEALDAGGAGFVLTLRNTSVLFAAGLSAIIGERPRRTEVFGAALVAIGAVLMAWK